MDSFRGRYQYSFRAHKPTSTHNIHYDANSHHGSPASCGILRPRIQKHTLKWRNGYYHRGSHRSNPPYRRNDISNKKTKKSAEDEEEEERKKKLNDTAQQLLNKIKTWNAEKNCSEGDSPSNNIKEVVNESSISFIKEKNNTEGKPKRIAHSKKTKLAKGQMCESFSQPRATRYDVNKDTVKDFQNRIQHKLIEEIMQMPKENLQNVLNDPKINPIMELKMSRLVRENKPLIAQKLRAIAESKMKSFDYPSNAQLLDDIDKLIDPVIETDLSVLPFELIKQMENIFQVQFDYTQNNSECLPRNDVGDNPKDSDGFAEDLLLETNDFVVLGKVENEDFSVYECSTDEDEESSARKSIECDSESAFKVLCAPDIKSEESEQKTCFEPIRSKIEMDSSPSKSSVNKETPQDLEDTSTTQSLPVENLSLSSEPVQNTSVSISCQTNCNLEDVSTQTVLENLYGAPLPKEANNGSISSLLDELNSIQTLINKLNEKRFMIFLELAKMNPSGSFISNDDMKNNFIESVSNGSLYLVESLKQFWSVYERENGKFRPSKSNLKWLKRKKNGTKNTKGNT